MIFFCHLEPIATEVFLKSFNLFSLWNDSIASVDMPVQYNLSWCLLIFICELQYDWVLEHIKVLDAIVFEFKGRSAKGREGSQ
jgi:hypothetical protein